MHGSGGSKVEEPDPDPPPWKELKLEKGKHVRLAGG
jgi:hypothetical protein